MLTVRHLMVGASFLSILAATASVAWIDPGTWWHVRSGEWMVTYGRILSHDEFSWTVHGHPWTNQSWLAEIAMYLIWRAAGFGGLSLAVGVLVTLAFGLAYLQTEGSVYLRSLTVLLAALASGVHWLLRPEIATLLLTSGFAYVLHEFRWAHSNRLWLLPPLMAVWVNLHGGFVIGFVLLGGVLVGQTADWLLGTRAPGVVGRRDVARLAATALACVAAALLNPYGPAILVLPFHLVSNSSLGFFQEWMSPNFHSGATQPFAALLLLTFAAVGLSGRRIDLTDLLLYLGFAYLALFAARNIALFALIVPPILTRHAAPALQHIAARYRALAPVLDPRAPSGRSSPLLNGAFALAMVATAAIEVAGPFRMSVDQAAIRNQMPVAAVKAVQAMRPLGPMFNADIWGGYLIWTLRAAYPVYIDDRLDLYGDARMREYLGIMQGQKGWRALFSRAGIRLIIVPPWVPLASILRHEPAWKQIYADSTAVVFTRP